MGLDVESLPKSIMLRIFPIFLWICLKDILKNKRGACYIVHHICVWSPWTIGKPMPLDPPFLERSCRHLVWSHCIPHALALVAQNACHGHLKPVNLDAQQLMEMDGVFRTRSCFYWQDSWTKISAVSGLEDIKIMQDPKYISYSNSSWSLIETQTCKWETAKTSKQTTSNKYVWESVHLSHHQLHQQCVAACGLLLPVAFLPSVTSHLAVVGNVAVQFSDIDRNGSCQ